MSAEGEDLGNRIYGETHANAKSSFGYGGPWHQPIWGRSIESSNAPPEPPIPWRLCPRDSWSCQSTSKRTAQRMELQGRLQDGRSQESWSYRNPSGIISESTITCDANAEVEVRTLMVKNIPCRCTQQQIRDAIEGLGFGSDYTLFYLPMRHGQSENLGYAFVGFFDKDVAAAFADAMTGYKFPGRSRKSCDVVLARIQGFQENLEHFVNTHTMHSQSGPLLRL